MDGKGVCGMERGKEGITCRLAPPNPYKQTTFMVSPLFFHLICFAQMHCGDSLSGDGTSSDQRRVPRLVGN